MTIVFEVWADGKKQEIIQPTNQRLKDIRSFIKAESSELIKKYGEDVYLNRRVLYN